jgi:tetratricopeptide (TPR) repeat protein
VVKLLVRKGTALFKSGNLTQGKSFSLNHLTVDTALECFKKAIQLDETHDEQLVKECAILEKMVVPKNESSDAVIKQKEESDYLFKLGYYEKALLGYTEVIEKRPDYFEYPFCALICVIFIP